MDVSKILAACDHTELSPSASWEDVKIVLDDALKYKTASVCIPPFFVKKAKEYAGDGLKICTVIGFPNGYNSTEVKVFEAKDALVAGADELDMVINIGQLKAGNDKFVEDEIRRLKEVCGEKVLKVIVETCLLTEEEKVRACRVVTAAGADYIKTSTGFSSGGATFRDIEIFKSNVGNGVKIKAAGGIKSLDDAERFLKLGADRLGTSRIVKIVKEEELNGK